MTRWIFILLIVSFTGIFDSAYLTYEHFSGSIPPCSVGTSLFSDCGKVLHSVYAAPFGVPLALVGIIFYSIEFLVLFFIVLYNHSRSQASLHPPPFHEGGNKTPSLQGGEGWGGAVWRKYLPHLAILLSTAGFGASAVFVYLQLFVLHAICLYCMLSAIVSTLLFIGAQLVFARERKELIVWKTRFLYKHMLRPILFAQNPETVHTFMVKSGSRIVPLPGIGHVTSYAFEYRDPRLSQTLADITFPSPIGLAAGFDYEADLGQTLAPLGFGFQSMGTITNLAYEGNPQPMLGRLVASRSLMVNKGFKNLGAHATILKLQGQALHIPVGISIGKTNHRNIDTQKKAIADIVKTFEAFEISRVNHSYYELNISCPNLFTSVTFYPKKNLSELVKTVDSLKLSKPYFVKMPISESQNDFLAMLDVVSRSKAAGVIIGNLSKDRKNPVLDPVEVKTWSVGHFSGKATWERSNELISLASKKYKKRFIIIGCGGVFSTEDAIEKFQRGANLIQLITGMIFEGPQLASSINLGLLRYMEKRGLQSINEIR